MKGVSIALACRAFDVNETCYRYSPKRDDENEQIADLLLGLTKATKTRGFGLCFLYLRDALPGDNQATQAPEAGEARRAGCACGPE